MDKPGKREELAEKYADGCDNESGGFLSHQLKAIRKKAHLAGQDAGRESRSAEVEEMRDARGLLAVVSSQRDAYKLLHEKAEAKLAEQAAEIALLKAQIKKAEE